MFLTFYLVLILTPLMFSIVLLRERDRNFHHVPHSQSRIFMSLRRRSGKKHVSRNHVTIDDFCVNLVRSGRRLQEKNKKKKTLNKKCNFSLIGKALRKCSHSSSMDTGKPFKRAVQDILSRFPLLKKKMKSDRV